MGATTNTFACIWYVPLFGRKSRPDKTGTESNDFSTKYAGMGTESKDSSTKYVGMKIKIV